jgi:hypothetical protein
LAKIVVVGIGAWVVLAETEVVGIGAAVVEVTGTEESLVFPATLVLGIGTAVVLAIGMIVVLGIDAAVVLAGIVVTILDESTTTLVEGTGEAVVVLMNGACVDTDTTVVGGVVVSGAGVGAAVVKNGGTVTGARLVDFPVVSDVVFKDVWLEDDDNGVCVVGDSVVGTCVGAGVTDVDATGTSVATDGAGVVVAVAIEDDVVANGDVVVVVSGNGGPVGSGGYVVVGTTDVEEACVD